MNLRRAAVLAYGAACYSAFLLCFVYLVLFLADVAWLPRTIERGPGASWPRAVLIDLALVAAFGLQHSVMARRDFKAWVTRHLPDALERPTYVLATVLVLVVMFASWHPLPHTLVVLDGTAAIVARCAFGGGVLLVLLSTFAIDHFELFGLRQVFEHWRGRAVSRPAFRVGLLHRVVRHPLYIGWIVTFFATPRLTAGHLLFALAMTSYILIAIPFEERDLAEEHGADYEDYRRRTPALLPRWPRRATAGNGAEPTV